MITYIRILLSVVLLYGVLLETGIFTVLSLALLIISNEIHVLMYKEK